LIFQVICTFDGDINLILSLLLIYFNTSIVVISKNISNRDC
jgi:hypothetical protein